MSIQQAKIKDFTDLKAWQEAQKLTVSIYETTKNFPKDEVFALTSQLRRASISVSPNIAEGFGRSSKLDKKHFYNMAQASVNELRSQIFTACDLSYINTELSDKLNEQAITTRKIISGLIRSLGV